MGRIVTTIEDEVEKRFAKMVIDIYGTSHTHFAQAVTEAFNLWVSQARKTKKEQVQEEPKSTPDTPSSMASSLPQADQVPPKIHDPNESKNQVPPPIAHQPPPPPQ